MWRHDLDHEGISRVPAQAECVRACDRRDHRSAGCFTDNEV